MQQRAFLSTAALTALFVTSAAANDPTVAPLIDTYDGGANFGGFSYNPGDVIEASGGNPGAWLHQATADTFAPIFTSSGSAYSGDFRAQEISLISFDARTDATNFGNGMGYSMSILLRDTKGTPNVDDDDYTYFVGDNVPLVGAGWKTFNYPIPSASTVAVPPGWKGGWVGDAENFRPGIDWSDVITSVDQVEIWWIDPAFFAIFQQWNIGLDNVLIVAPGSSVARNGAGTNPNSYVETSPATIGGSFDATIDIATPGAIASAVVLGFGGPTSGMSIGGSVLGELLILGPYQFDFASGVHSLAIPFNKSLLGACVPTQGLTVDASGIVQLENALDVTVGG